ncbi:hypothetical protein AGMMS49965_02330 [Bacteroidia bacterium]|nr:hypothetical protein AGMMS49965_02330 [Bacteroidia bacterium]
MNAASLFAKNHKKIFKIAHDLFFIKNKLQILFTVVPKFTIAAYESSAYSLHHGMHNIASVRLKNSTPKKELTSPYKTS